jgi:AcrR family transcriptional regulator
LEVVKATFTRSGADASLDDIAKQAGVGPGTLYRHFPTRDALIAAVYHTEVEKLAAAQHELSANLPPIEALRAWMMLFVDYIATKQIIASALNSVRFFPRSRNRSDRCTCEDCHEERRLVDILIKGSRPIK